MSPISQIIKELSAKLNEKYDKGFSSTNLRQLNIVCKFLVTDSFSKPKLSDFLRRNVPSS